MQTNSSKTPNSSQSSNKLANTLFFLMICLAVGFGGGWIGAMRQAEQSSGNSGAQQVIVNESQAITTIAKEVGPSVVSIGVTNQTTRTDFFGNNSPIRQEGAGTGVIISEDGYVMTNRHVVGSKDAVVTVTLSDGTQLEDVDVVGIGTEGDPLDVAFLKINDTKGQKLVAAKLGDSSKVQVGEKVVAIGNALGQFQNSVTAGIISGYGRSVIAGDSVSQESLQNLFQTDAAINQGNSGGPLVNASSEVIGINTAVAGDGAENIGFAIPINDLQGLINSVLKNGTFERTYLGVRYINLTDDYAYVYNLPVKRGAYLAPVENGSPVLPNSPAQKADLQAKDIIIKIDGTTIDEKNSLTSLIGRKSVGDEVELTIIRDGNEQTLKAKLEAAPKS